MKPGRKPKPTYIKLMRGNPGRRPINRREPIPRGHSRVPRPPKSVADNLVAKKEWHRIGKELVRLNLLTKMDVVALEQYCCWYASWRHAYAMCQAEGAVIETKNGNLVQNPYLAIMRRCSEMLYRYMIEFGMTPSSRTRIEVETLPDPDSDPLFD